MPIAGMQRYLNEPLFGNGEFADVAAVSQYFKERADRAIWSPSSAGPGHNSAANSHGGFDDDEATMGSVGEFIRS
jgi:hypothetical protein